MRRSAEAVGRDPASIEVTASSYCTDADEAIAEARALKELGVTRVVIPAALFREDPGSLFGYGASVIGRV